MFKTIFKDKSENTKKIKILKNRDNQISKRINKSKNATIFDENGVFKLGIHTIIKKQIKSTLHNNNDNEKVSKITIKRLEKEKETPVLLITKRIKK